MSRWYAIEKKAPATGQLVLVVAENEKPLPDFPHFYDKFIAVAKYMENESFVVREVCSPPFIKITHWKPLPKLPSNGMKIPDAIQAIVFLVMSTVGLALATYFNWDNLPKVPSSIQNHSEQCLVQDEKPSWCEDTSALTGENK